MDTSDGEDRRVQRSSSGSTKIKRQTSHKSSTKTKKKSSRTSVPSDEPIEMLTSKQNGYVEEDGGGAEGEDDKNKQTASIKLMWKKAFKALKSNDKQTWLSKKGSFIKKKEQEPPEEEQPEKSKEIDPVYSLLKCAADLPKVPNKAQKEGQCSGHLSGKGENSSESTSKASSPSSSGAHTHSSSHGGVGGESASGGQSSPGASGVTNREHMHHIVDETLGSEFKTFYKLTSPVRKHHVQDHASTKKHLPNAGVEHK